ncbi:MAG: spore coat protein [Bacilli bacterium]|nr:spore coat protein [Bacillota bacterium]MBQ6282441.1 spore coat protein [Bacilli bacterium]
MNDQLLMENYLLVLKSTVEVYVHGTLESSNPDVRDTLKLGLDETIKHQERTYDEMTNYGWYTISNIDSKKIKQTLNSVKNN